MCLDIYTSVGCCCCWTKEYLGAHDENSGACGEAVDHGVPEKGGDGAQAQHGHAYLQHSCHERQ